MRVLAIATVALIALSIASLPVASEDKELLHIVSFEGDGLEGKLSLFEIIDKQGVDVLLKYHIALSSKATRVLLAVCELQPEEVSRCLAHPDRSRASSQRGSHTSYSILYSPQEHAFASNADTLLLLGSLISDCKRKRPDIVLSESRLAHVSNLLVRFMKIAELKPLYHVLERTQASLTGTFIPPQSDSQAPQLRDQLQKLDLKNPESGKILIRALDDVDPEIVTIALLKICKLPKENRNAELHNKIQTTMLKWWNEEGHGKLSANLGYRFPIRELSECLLKNWESQLTIDAADCSVE